jgi:hypothetical protein
MAEKRMASKVVIDRDDFIELQHSTQLLYFHLLIRGDDEGFVSNPKTVMRLLNCCDTDLLELVRCGFVITFNTGVLVITHWFVHNNLRKDRSKISKYVNERAQLILDDTSIYRLTSFSGSYPDIFEKAKAKNEDNREEICNQVLRDGSSKIDNKEKHSNVDNQEFKIDNQELKADNQKLINDGHLSTQISIVEEKGDKSSRDKDNENHENFLLDKNDYQRKESKPLSEDKAAEPYGSYKNVFLTETEYIMLVDEGLSDYIEKLSSYMKDKGKKYSNHYDTIMRWYNSAKEREQNVQKHRENNNRNPKFSIKPGVNI